MLLQEWKLEDELAATKQDAWEEGMKKEREKVISLIEQGVSLDEIKKILPEEQPPKSR